MLIDSWAQIFSIYSRESLTDITRSFDKYFDISTSTNIFRLISRIQGNQQFSNALLFSVNQARKKKVLTSKMLSNLSLLISRLNCDKHCLNEFYKIAVDCKGNNALKEGRQELLSTLYSRMPTLSKKMQSFYARLFKQSHDDPKVSRSIKAFLQYIQGDISHIISDDLSPLDFIGSCGSHKQSQSGPDSYISIFMRVFYPKYNFSISTETFRNVMIQLVSINISEFTEIILPSFTKLEPTDPRFLVLLMIVPIINQKEFLERSYCNASQDQLKIINFKIRQVLLEHMDKFEKSVENGTLTLIKDSYQLNKTIDEADNTINAFLMQNDIPGFEKQANPPFTRITTGNQSSVLYNYLKCIKIVFSDEDFLNCKLIELILKLVCNYDQLLSTTALEIYETIFTKETIQMTFLKEALNLITNSVSREMISKLSELILNTISKPSFKCTNELFEEIEGAAFSLFINDSPYCRVQALRIFNVLLPNERYNEYIIFLTSSRDIVETAINLIQIHYTGEKPSIIKPIIGSLTFETVCSSNFNDLWIIYFSEMLNNLISTKRTKILIKIKGFIKNFNHYIQLIKNNVIGTNVLTLLFIFYFDTYSVECLNLSMNEEEEITSINISKEAQKEVQKILSSNIKECIISLIISFRYINWSVIPSILSLLLSIDERYYPQILKTLNIIIQNPNNYSNIISLCLSELTNFLVSIQTFFIHLGINGPKNLKLNKENLELIHKYEDVCIDYCILIAALFNNENVQDLLTEEDWPISSRQLHLQFLFNWIELPNGFEKLKAYLLNALIPIINIGKVFTNGFSFNFKMLETFLQCQLSGYSILNKLLYYHMEILLDEFSTQVFLKQKRESNAFIEAIVECIDICEDPKQIQDHIGYLILVSMYCSNDKIESSKTILLCILKLLLKLKPDNESYLMIKNAKDLNMVPNIFQFATERVIESGFNILNKSQRIMITETIVNLLIPWIEKLRILPTQKYIIQGIPSKYRRFTIVSFFDSIFNLSKKFTEKTNDIFSRIWFQLLKSADNSIVVLLFISEYENDDLKTKIFEQLLDKDPKLIIKYLAKRCTFAYWYFQQITKKNHMLSLEWVRRILASAFLYYPVIASTHFTSIFHYTMLFIEDSLELFEDIMAIFEIETNDYINLWDPISTDGTLTVSVVVTQIALMLTEQESVGFDKWNNEAIRWAVSCSNLKIAYRSLVILNSIQNPSDINIHLFFEAVKYHLSNSNEDNCEYLTKYVSEVFKFLFFHIDDATVSNPAFRFASSFLHCVPFENNALRYAMPIFLHCVNLPVIGTLAKSLLIDAFLPFASIIETDEETREMFIKIIKIVNKPELLLIAAPFLLKNKQIPFNSIDYTYDEILNFTFNTETVQIVLSFFNRMLKTASSTLADSILITINDLLHKFNTDNMNHSYLTPIYEYALKNGIPLYESAINLIHTIIKIDPLIAFMNEEEISNSSSFRFVIKQIDEISNAPSKVISITDCKDLNQLFGLLDQRNPPKIHPFSTQYEMYLALQKEPKIDNNKSNRARILNSWSASINSNSMSSTTSLMMSPAIHAINESENVAIHQLEKKAVIFKTLDLPNYKPSNWRLIASLDEFAQMNE